MEIKTRVFQRILTERMADAAARVRRAAVKAIADTMEETARFGCFGRDYVEGCAEHRLEQAIIEN